MRLHSTVLAGVGFILLISLCASAVANPYYAESRRALHRLIKIPPSALTDAERDSLVWLLGSGGADDLGRDRLITLNAQMNDFLPMLRQAQLYPHQPSLQLQRLIRRHGSMEDLADMGAFLKRWLVEPPDSIYSRAAGAMVKPSARRVLKLQIIAAEALVEYRDPVADSLIGVLLERVDRDASRRAGKSSQRRYLELARMRLRGNELGTILFAEGGDTLRCWRDLNAVRSARLATTTPWKTGCRGVSRQYLRTVLACLQRTLRASGRGTGIRGDLRGESILLTLHFQDGLTASLAPFGQDRVRYQDDSYSQGVYYELLDAQLNVALRNLPQAVEVPTSHAMRQKP